MYKRMQIIDIRRVLLKTRDAQEIVAREYACLQWMKTLSVPTTPVPLVTLFLE